MDKLKDKQFYLQIKDSYLEVQQILLRRYEKTKDDFYLSKMKKLKEVFKVFENKKI